MAKMTARDKELLLAMSIEIDETGKNKYTQQELADYFKISKGMVNRYVKEKVNISKQIISDEIELKTKLHNLEVTKSKLLSKQEQMEVNKQVDDKIKHLILFQTSSLKNQEMANESLYSLERTIKSIENEQERDAISMKSISILKEHANITKTNKETVLGKDPDMIINNSNNQQTNIKSLDDFYDN